ncbi:MAG TPA: SseB family protein [Polyangiaceae bacterium]
MLLVARQVTAAGSESTSQPDLTALVLGARRGLRRDVAALEAALDEASLLIPLAQGIDHVPEGEDVALEGGLEIFPHYIVDPEGLRFAALFTQPALLEPIAQALKWTTDGGELGVCALPARIACELALGTIDEKEIQGLVIDPGAESELMLRRSELASIVAGHALPLVGYLHDLPPLDDEKVLVAENEPPPAAFLAALEACLAGLPAVTAHRLERTFNPERDLEPHLTLRLSTDGSKDRRALAHVVIQAVGELVPPPGYIDVLFDDA